MVKILAMTSPRAWQRARWRLGQQTEAGSSTWILKSSRARPGIVLTRQQVILVLKSSMNVKGGGEGWAGRLARNSYVSTGLGRQVEQRSGKSNEGRKLVPPRVRGRTVGKQASIQESDAGNVMSGREGRVLVLKDTSERDCRNFPDAATTIAESTVEALGEKFRESGGKSPMTEWQWLRPTTCRHQAD